MVKSEAKRRPLLAIDGDSFAHRSYHALPKTIFRKGKRPAGAILGFANRLLQFYRAEQPRAVLVAWDTLEEPTYRHAEFPAYQSGRVFDEELLDQLRVLPEFLTACGLANGDYSIFGWMDWAHGLVRATVLSCSSAERWASAFPMQSREARNLVLTSRGNLREASLY